jgi:methylated-DNA-protein-cysteine methyltransferase-like protein
MGHCRSECLAWSNAAVATRKRKRSTRDESRSASASTVTGEPRVVGPGFRARVYAAVKRVPKGAVTTYGDVAGALGSRRVARQVGFALAALDDDSVPWQRVINASGRISFRGDPVRGTAQQRLLEREGIAFDDTGRVVDFEQHRHKFAPPRTRR